MPRSSPVFHANGRRTQPPPRDARVPVQWRLPTTTLRIFSSLRRDLASHLGVDLRPAEVVDLLVQYAIGDRAGFERWAAQQRVMGQGRVKDTFKQERSPPPS
ncbi:MAG: hypothetical protein ACYDDF_13275 [Thermoplasmatota archaeon]